MPYIEEDSKEGAEILPTNAGELSYNLAKTIIGYLNLKNPNTYQDFNDVIGVLESLKMEIYRVVVVPYEEMKRSKNGDVFS